MLWSTGSRRKGFSSYSTQAQLPFGLWDLPRLGIQPVSPALAGGFLTTGPPGKSRKLGFIDTDTGVSVLHAFYIVGTVLNNLMFPQSASSLSFSGTCVSFHQVIGFPRWLSGKESACLSCKRLRFSSSVEKIAWRRAWHSTPVFLPGEFHGQRSLAGYFTHTELTTTEAI